MCYKEQLKELEVNMLEIVEAAKGSARTKPRNTKMTSAKKEKRFCLYGARSSKTPVLDNSQLIETPTEVENKSVQWALVASPNKPPSYP